MWTVDVQSLGCDFYVFSGHKMLGPMGTGVVWGRRSLLDAMPPYHVGSNMAHDVTATGAVLERGALKYQAGTPDVAGPVGLSAAVSFVQQAGRDARSAPRRGACPPRAASSPGSAGPAHHGSDRCGAARARVYFHRRRACAWGHCGALNQQGIAVRAGDMAALPLLRRFGVSEAVRASAYVYTTHADLDRLADGLLELPRS